MDIAALIAWVLTALGGFAMAGIWLSRGGMRQQETGATRFPAPALLGHLLLAAAGLVVWLVYLASDDSDALAWAAVVILVPVAALGLALFTRWLGVRGQATPTADDDEPAERYIPAVVAGGHGVLAVITVVLVVLAAAGVGT